MRISDKGVADGVRYVASPHCDFRPQVQDIRLLVMHSISLPPGEFSGPQVEALFAGRLDWDAHPLLSEHPRAAGFGPFLHPPRR